MAATGFKQLIFVGAMLALATETVALAQPPLTPRDTARGRSSVRLARRQYDPLDPTGMPSAGPPPTTDSESAGSLPTPAAVPENISTPAPMGSSSDSGSVNSEENSGGLLGELQPIPEDEEFEEEQASVLSSSGTFYNAGCWYVQTEAVMMHRKLQKKGLILSADLSAALPGQVAILKLDPGQQQFAPGGWITFGHFLGRDSKNRDSAIEFSYLGDFHWSTSESLTSRLPNAIFTTINANEQPGGFNDASTQSFTSDSTLASYEINYRLSRRLSRDRMVLSRNGDWVRTLAPSLLPTLIAGFRVVTVGDSFHWQSQGSDPAITSGLYNVNTHNTLVGFQFGSDLAYQHEEWRLGVRVKGGPFVNSTDQSSFVRQVVDSTTQPIRDENARQTVVSFVGDVKLTAAYFFRPNFALRASYDLMWLNQVTMAPYQLTFEPSNPPEIKVGSNVFFQSGSLGFEYIW